MDNQVTKNECDQHMNDLRREMIQCMESKDLRIMFDISKIIDEKLDKFQEKNSANIDSLDKKLEVTNGKIDDFISTQTKIAYVVAILIFVILLGLITGRGFDYFLAVI